LNDEVASEIARLVMSGLSQGLQQLVNAERFASRPTFADSERVLRMIQSQLGIAIGVSGVVVSTSLAGVSFRPHVWSSTAKALAGLGLIVAAVALVHSAMPGASTINDTASGDPAADTKASAELDVVATTNQPQGSTHQETTLAATAQPSPSATPQLPAGALGRRRDNLSEEVAILSRAEEELHGGRARNALILLNEHERKYRHGALTEERIAARIQALCALGRGTEADSLLHQLPPKSLHGGPTGQACVAARVVPADR
jgi:hypothetical protein